MTARTAMATAQPTNKDFMSYLQTSAQWHNNINQVETGEPITGGADGNANLATKQLADNTLFLKQKLDNLGFSEQLEETGFCKLPNGLTLQWGKLSLGASEQKVDVTFAMPFAHQCLNMTATATMSQHSPNGDMTPQIVSLTPTGAVVSFQNLGTDTTRDITGFYYQAIGY